MCSPACPKVFTYACRVKSRPGTCILHRFDSLVKHVYIWYIHCMKGGAPMHDATKRILLIEDGAAMRQLIWEILTPAYELQLASGVAEAYARLAAFGGEGFDLVIADHDLGGETSEKLVGQIANTHPKLPILAISGTEHGNEQLLKAGLAKACPSRSRSESLSG